MKKHGEEGVSLLELLLVIGIIGAITASVGYMFVGAMRAWNVEDRRNEVLRNNQDILSQVADSLERARYILTADLNDIEFTVELGLAAGTEDGLHLLRSGAASWENLNGIAPLEVPAGTSVTDLVQLEDTTLVTAGSDGFVYRSADYGKTWHPVKIGDASEVRALEKLEDGTIFAATANKGDVYKSTDSGLTWNNTAELENAVTVRSLASSPDATVWAGTDWTGSFNVFKTSDGGASWTGAASSGVPPDTWAFRRPVYIAENSDTNLRDYQVRIPVAYAASKMNLDFSDIRFRDGSGADLPYWMEFADDGNYAVFWVKVPRIDRSSTLTIFMYYGNSSSVSLSDFSSTMNDTYDSYDISYEWTPQVSWTSLVSEDDGGEWVDLQYGFPWFGTSQDRIYACSNGFLSIGSTCGDDDNPRMNSFRGYPMIAPFWEDLRTDLSYGSITQPGIYVDSYEDRTVCTWHAVSFRQWRIGPIRYRAELLFQVQTSRNGDVRLSYGTVRNTRRMSPIAGLSRGDNSSHLTITNDVGEGRSFLLAQREYVEPEPSVTFGDEEILASTSTDVLSLCFATGVLYSGTSDGQVLYSTDGGSGWSPAAELVDAGFVYSLFRDSSGILFAGTEPGGIVFRSDEPSVSWSTCETLAGAERVRHLGSTIEKRLVCGASPTGLLYTSADKGVSWKQLPPITGASTVNCSLPVLSKMGFSWSGTAYADSGDRNDMVLRQSGASGSVISNGYTSDFHFEYFDSDMTPADTSTAEGIADITTIRVTVESSLDEMTITNSVSITLRNAQ